MSPSGNVLSQKLRHGGLARSPLADTELLGETFARGVEDRIRLMVKTVIGTTVGAVRVAKLADATGAITGPAVLGLVDVEDADTPGLIALEPDLAWHLVDLTLGGDPVQAPAPFARPFTAIDMALCRLHLDAILAAFAHAIGANLGHPLTKGLTIRDLRQSLSQLRLAPDYIDVMVFGVDLSLGEAGRRGRFTLVLPLSTLDVIRASIQARNVQAARDRPNDLWKTLMRRAAASAPVPSTPSSTASPSASLPCRASRSARSSRSPARRSRRSASPSRSPAAAPRSWPRAASASTSTTRSSSSPRPPTPASSPTSSAPSARRPTPPPTPPNRQIPAAPSPSTPPSPSLSPPPKGIPAGRSINLPTTRTRYAYAPCIGCA